MDGGCLVIQGRRRPAKIQVASMPPRLKLLRNSFMNALAVNKKYPQELQQARPIRYK
jgi:hypothetical protein